MRVGFAGAGFIAGVHAGVLAAQPGTKLTTVFDPNESHAGAFAAKTGARTVPSFEDLLASCDAVYICAPNVHHAGMAVAALEAGLHVFSEKPMATSPAEARRVYNAAERASGVYQIGFNKRYAAVYTELKRRIEDGRLGARWANMKMNRGELLKPSWVGDPSHTGGYLYETPIHLLDMASWLFGPVTEAVCRARQTCSAQLDDFAIILTFASGMAATLTSSAHTTWLFPYERVEVYGEYATAVTEEMERVTFQHGLEAQPELLDVSDLPVARRWGYAAGDEAFLAAIRDGKSRAAGVREGLAAVALVDACYRAAESWLPVRL
ncbi:MAG: Gfo/Idh/MocA family oxidoreductase [Dehalococcoidia bacterium]